MVRLERRMSSRGRLSTKKLDRRSSPSPVRFGLDLEVQEKMEAKYDYHAEALAMDWIEEITGEAIDDFYTDFKSGLMLCQLINCISPGLIKKVHTRDIPLLHRENIENYLKACSVLGLKNHELFVVNDLYESKSLSSVIRNIQALGRSVGGRNGIPEYPKELPDDHYLREPTTTITSENEQTGEPEISIEIDIEIPVSTQPGEPKEVKLPVPKFTGTIFGLIVFALYLAIVLLFILLKGAKFGIFASLILALVVAISTYLWYKYKPSCDRTISVYKRTEAPIEMKEMSTMV